MTDETATQEEYNWFNTDDLDDIPELKSLPDGTEAEIVIMSTQTGVGGNGPWLRAILEIAGDDLAKDISFFVPQPSPRDTVKQGYANKRRLRAFFDAFQIPREDWNNPLAWEGLTAKAILKEEEKGEYGKQNSIRKFT